MIFYTKEYTGWDEHVKRKRINEQFKQIKEEWKGAADDYFGVSIPPEPTVAHMKQIEFQISKLRKDIYTIHTRINGLQDAPPKIKQIINEIKEANVIGRIEALEQWRADVADRRYPTRLDRLEHDSLIESRTIYGLTERLTKLEDKLDNEIHSTQDTKCSHGHDSGVFICMKDLADRVDKLKETLRLHEGPYHDGLRSRINELEIKMNLLERNDNK